MSEQATVEQLPIHETAVCPQCRWAGVMIQHDLCTCAGCGYKWRWPLYAGMVGLD